MLFPTSPDLHPAEPVLSAAEKIRFTGWRSKNFLNYKMHCRNDRNHTQHNWASARSARWPSPGTRSVPDWSGRLQKTVFPHFIKTLSSTPGKSPVRGMAVFLPVIPAVHFSNVKKNCQCDRGAADAADGPDSAGPLPAAP